MKRRELGVISDTHGLMRPEALAALRGVERIVHAGDVGSAEVLARLNDIAPVSAVRGNNDRGPWADALPLSEVVEVGDVTLYVLHDLHELDLEPRAAGFAAVISGHSHQPRVDTKDGVLYLNPGSAGPRRFKLPICLARLTVDGTRVRARLVTLSGLSSREQVGARPGEYEGGVAPFGRRIVRAEARPAARRAVKWPGDGPGARALFKK